MSAEISMETVEEYMQHAWNHIIYCYGSSCATTLQSSYFHLDCFKNEVLKFCQNPDAEFDERMIKQEMTEEYIRQYCFNTEEKQEYHYLKGSVYVPNASTIIREMVKERREIEFERLKKAVRRISALIRQEELGDDPRTAKKVFEEIRNKQQII